MPDAPLFAPQFVSPRHRDEAAELGMWVFIATEVLLFGGLLLAYFVYRHAYLAAFAAASRRTDIVIGTANTAILLTSSFLVAWAVHASAARARAACVALLAGAVLLGLAFIVLKGIEYSDEYREHLVPGIDFGFDGPLANGVQLFFVFYFVATAIHALHMLVGIGLLTTLALLIRRADSSRHIAALHSAALYWHFVDVVWIFLFALIYLPGRSVT
jgi:cytochrome c oxidase subunit III